MKRGNEITDDDDFQKGYEECKGSVDDSNQTSGLQSSKRRRLDIDSDSEEEEVELTEGERRFMRAIQGFCEGEERRRKEANEKASEQKAKQLLIVQSARNSGSSTNLINLLPNEVAEHMTNFLSLSALVTMGQVSHHWSAHVDDSARIRGLERLLPGGRVSPFAPSATWQRWVLPVDGFEGVPVFTVARLDCGSRGGYEDSGSVSDEDTTEGVEEQEL